MKDDHAMKLKSVLQREERVLAAERYPGDLAEDVLAQAPRRRLWILRPVGALALVALCLSLLGWPGLNHSIEQGAMADHQALSPDAESTYAVQVGTQPEVVAAPTSILAEQVATPGISRSSRAWLPMPIPRGRALTLSTKPVASPTPKRPALAGLSIPSRRDMNRLFEQTRNPKTKTERT